jgi:peptidoglycan LD-endopeptidase LytH
MPHLNWRPALAAAALLALSPSVAIAAPSGGQLASAPTERAHGPAFRSANVTDRACPVEPPSTFIDSWGAPRSGGRRHQGVDIMAPRGAKVYAYDGGVVTKTTVNRGLGGTTVWIRGDDGTRYYYAHLLRFTVRNGQRVSTGQIVGAVGNTGNASRTAPHLHFEIRPAGSPVNPFPYVKRVCG